MHFELLVLKRLPALANPTGTYYHYRTCSTNRESHVPSRPMMPGACLPSWQLKFHFPGKRRLTVRGENRRDGTACPRASHHGWGNALRNESTIFRASEGRKDAGAK